METKIPLEHVQSEEISMRRRFCKAFKAFSQNTTFHGFRYIVDSTYLPRRFLWILVVLACVGAVGYQIFDRINFFLSWNVNVNVQINYNRTLTFPAVTICNQNAFRATEAAKQGHYRLIERMFTKQDSGSSGTLDNSRFDLENISMEHLYRDLGHRKEDLVVSCKWSNGECGPEDFRMVLTDHGLCYMFEGTQTGALVSSAGVDAGLRLTLNAEQYEYMTGPHDAAGIKILLHDREEFPFVHELGQAIPTGSHAFVGVKMLIIKNIESYGTCGDKKLEFGGHYTIEACFLDCLTKLAVTACGCRDIYMPHVDGFPPVCSVTKYYGCLEHVIEKFHTDVKNDCVCPVPCRFDLYDPALSYATVSNFVVSKLLTTNESRTLETKLVKASEVTSRMERSKFEQLTSLVQNVLIQFSKVQQLLDRNITTVLIKGIELANLTQAYMNEAYTEKERLYRYQEFIIDRSFLRGREAMEERTLRNVPLGYAEFALLAVKRIRRLAEMHSNDTARGQLYTLIIDALKTRQEIVDMAGANFTQLVDSFKNGTPIFTYIFEDIPVDDNTYIVPKPLLKHALTHNDYVLEHRPKLAEDIDRLHMVLDWFMGIATVAYEDNTVNETQLGDVYERFQFACRTFMFSKSVFYSQGIEFPLKVIKSRHDEFDILWDNFQLGFNDMKQNLLSLSKSLKAIKSDVLPRFRNLLTKSETYLNETEGDKIMLAKDYVSDKSRDIARDIRVFFQEIQTRGQSVYDDWTKLFYNAKQLWNMIINDEDMMAYYDYRNLTHFLNNFTVISRELESNYTGIRDNYDLRLIVANQDGELFEAFEDLTNHLQAYMDSLRIDGSFVKENFLQLDIFYRQLSYEQITQQPAYDFFALVCDIGGAMGLFIGASMITVVEILDLILTQTPLFNDGEKRKQ